MPAEKPARNSEKLWSKRAREDQDPKSSTREKRAGAKEQDVQHAAHKLSATQDGRNVQTWLLVLNQHGARERLPQTESEKDQATQKTRDKSGGRQKLREQERRQTENEPDRGRVREAERERERERDRERREGERTKRGR